MLRADMSWLTCFRTITYVTNYNLHSAYKKIRLNNRFTKLRHRVYCFFLDAEGIRSSLSAQQPQLLLVNSIQRLMTILTPLNKLWPALFLPKLRPDVRVPVIISGPIKVPYVLFAHHLVNTYNHF